MQSIPRVRANASISRRLTSGRIDGGWKPEKLRTESINPASSKLGKIPVKVVERRINFLEGRITGRPTIKTTGTMELYLRDETKIATPVALGSVNLTGLSLFVIRRNPRALYYRHPCVIRTGRVAM